MMMTMMIKLLKVTVRLKKSRRRVATTDVYL